MRKLYNFYGMRRDYGDGEFPSVWPSEIEQDRVRGYDFVAMAPKANYQDMLWEIAQYVPVVTGKWPSAGHQSTSIDGSAAGDETDTNGTAGTTWSAETAALAQKLSSHISGALFSESDVDELGQSLWVPFYDYGQQVYRQYHRLSKRVKPLDAYDAPSPEQLELNGTTEYGYSDNNNAAPGELTLEEGGADQAS